MDETHKYDISKQEEEIRKRQKQINEIYKKRMDKYFQLREIMENVKKVLIVQVILIILLMKKKIIIFLLFIL